MTPFHLFLTSMVALSSGSSSLEGWDWAIGDTPSEWKRTDVPFVRMDRGESVTLWLQTSLPACEIGEPVALLLGYKSEPFDVFVGSQRVYQYLGSQRETPWHLVPLPQDASGQTLRIRVSDVPRGGARVVGFRWGIRVGARADHYLWMLREEWRTVAQGVALLTMALVALVAEVLARIRKQRRPYAPFAVLCATYALWLIPQNAGYLAFLIFPHQDLLDACSRLMGSTSTAVGIWYVRQVFKQPLRLGLDKLAWVTVAYGLYTSVGRLLGLPGPSDGVQVYRYISITISIVMLANVALAWRASSRALRVISVGLVLTEACSLIEYLASWAALPGAALAVADIGFVGFLSFVLLSLVVVSAETRTYEDREREKHARTHAVAQIATMFAHDVRKPFAVTRMALQSLRSAKTRDEVASILDVATEEVEQVTGSVSEMISDILEAGTEAPPKLADEELGDCLEQVLRNLRRLGEAKDVALSYELGHSHQLHVQRSKLERICTNIMCNALEATNGRCHIWFRSRDVRQRNRSFVELTIGNSDSYIPPEQVKRVFEPFFSGSKRAGTGLGLTIAKTFVEAHGGTIWCRSLSGLGVEFVFTLPASELTARRAPALPERICDETPARESAEVYAGSDTRHVLLVEDSRAVRHAWSQRLPEGLLRAFGSPTELLAAADENPALLSQSLVIVLDNRFGPGEMDGVSLGELLAPRTEAPILLCTGVPLSPLPPWCAGQLEKDTYDLEGLAAAVQGRRGAAHG
ncbi:MAG: hybrid sensor histidine kinase/response regulator [Myxococcaceae bacterium]|nr:hybrid sensor histidine kinase/response regulator [Myxococcaceae bacterium]